MGWGETRASKIVALYRCPQHGLVERPITLSNGCRICPHSVMIDSDSCGAEVEGPIQARVPVSRG